jgi:Flp pilus assembly CpaE family ATPase
MDTNASKRVRSKVIGFFGGKGGTGKTMVAANVASLLAKKVSELCWLTVIYSLAI